MKTRRKFLKQTAAITSLAAIPSMLNAAKRSGKMIHQVFFWLHEGVDPAEFVQIAKTLGKCKTVSKVYVGTPAPTEDRDVVDHSYQVACTFFFDSLEDQEIYQVDPIHLDFIEKHNAKWSKVIVYDFMI